jgi:hypothetical protein
MTTTGVRRSGIAVCFVVGALAAPASASAAVQIGTTFPGANLSCGDNVTALQTTSAAGSYAAPSAGVITSWSVQPTGAVPIALKLKFARAAGGNDFTIVGESPPKAPTSGVLNTYTDVRFSVQPGDIIGYYADQGPMGTFCGKTDSNFAARNVAGDQAPGATATYSTLVPSMQFSFSALLEPDCDGDGFGDETQDSDLSACQPPPGPQPIAGRNVTLDANKNKVKEGKRVGLSGQVNETVRQGPCESGQTVQLQRKRPKATTFTTVEQLQTDAAGRFSTKKKVKKTFEFRAQVPETATCAGQISNIEKVKVKKKA